MDKKARYTILILLPLIFIVTACKIALGAPEEFGSLSCSVHNDSSSKTIIPDLPSEGYLECYSYTLSGIGPNGNAIAAMTNATGIFNIESLTPGLWTITIEARNSDNALIASADAQILVEAGKTTAATLRLSPLSGKGTLSLDIRWPADKPVDIVEGTLSSETHNDITMEFSRGEGVAIFEDIIDSGEALAKVSLF